MLDWNKSSLIFIITSYAFCPVSADGSGLHPSSTVSQTSIPYDRDATGSDPLSKLPFNDSRLADTSRGVIPSQVHLTYKTSSSVIVSWSTGQGLIHSTADANSQHSAAAPSSTVWFGTSSGHYTAQASSDATTSYQQTYNFTNANPNFNYSSPLFHHVALQGLTPDTPYFYKCGDSGAGVSQEFNFTSPPAIGTYPFVLGVVSDTGLTPNTTVTIQHLVDAKPQVWTLIGDFSYADDLQTNGSSFVSNGSFAHVPFPTGTYQPWWDMWFRYMQTAIMSSIPLLPQHGNHELEPQYSSNYGVGLDGGHQFQSYVARNPVATLAGASGSDRPLWYSVDVGPAHMVYLSNYAEFEVGSDQYEWLRKDLSSFDRKTTPWLVATFHAPFYSSYTAHYLENECMRQAMEGLLYTYGVNVIFNGHLHVYERTFPMYKFAVDECGPVHIIIGDGGNIEGVYKTYADDLGECPTPSVPSYQKAGGFCPVHPYNGSLCASSQPAWSAFREPSFGHGILTFMNSTTALWQWNRNLDNEAVVADSVYITRKLSCSSKQLHFKDDPTTDVYPTPTFS